MMRLLLLLLLIAACDSPTSNPSSVDVRGSWEYRATQAAPALNIEGVLQITEQSSNVFTGTATFSEIDVQGTRRTRVGVLSGRVVGSDVVDFDVYLDTQTRRHVARLAADSLGGTWSASGTAGQSGPFSARKLP